MQLQACSCSKLIPIRLNIYQIFFYGCYDLSYQCLAPQGFEIQKEVLNNNYEKKSYFVLELLLSPDLVRKLKKNENESFTSPDYAPEKHQ